MLSLSVSVSVSPSLALLPPEPVKLVSLAEEQQGQRVSLAAKGKQFGFQLEGSCWQRSRAVPDRSGSPGERQLGLPDRQQNTKLHLHTSSRLISVLQPVVGSGIGKAIVAATQPTPSALLRPSALKQTLLL